MKKLFINSVLAFILPITMAATSCSGRKECQPYAVRQDSNQAGKWWVCNSDGTDEIPYRDPNISPRPVEVKF